MKKNLLFLTLCGALSAFSPVAANLNDILSGVTHYGGLAFNVASDAIGAIPGQAKKGLQKVKGVCGDGKQKCIDFCQKAAQYSPVSMDGYDVFAVSTLGVGAYMVEQTIGLHKATVPVVAALGLFYQVVQENKMNSFFAGAAFYLVMKLRHYAALKRISESKPATQKELEDLMYEAGGLSSAPEMVIKAATKDDVVKLKDLNLRKASGITVRNSVDRAIAAANLFVTAKRNVKNLEILLKGVNEQYSLAGHIFHYKRWMNVCSWTFASIPGKATEVFNALLLKHVSQNYKV